MQSVVYMFTGPYNEREIFRFAMRAGVKPDDKLFLVNMANVEPEMFKGIIDIVVIRAGLARNLVEDVLTIVEQLKQLKPQKIKLGLGFDTYLAFTALLSTLLYKNVSPNTVISVFIDNDVVGFLEQPGPREQKVLCYLKDKTLVKREDVVKALTQEFKIRAITMYKTLARMEEKGLINVDAKKGTIDLTTIGKLIAAVSCT